MKILSRINKVVFNLSAVVLLVMTVIVLLQILFRYVLKIPFPSAPEYAIFSMIWMIMLGSTINVRNKSHIAVAYFADKLPFGAQKVVKVIVSLLLITFFVILSKYGYELGMKSMTNIAPASRVPLGWIVISIPISAAISILYVIEQMIADLLNLEKQGVEHRDTPLL